MREISAGGVVYRVSDDKVEILMIEDRYGRWTLPKGKMEEGETEEETALREIWEETGVRGSIVRPLQTVQYAYQHPTNGNVDKEVHYYLVRAVKGETRPQLEEIRRTAWLPLDEAWQRQRQDGYENNEPVLGHAIRRLRGEQ